MLLGIQTAFCIRIGVVQVVNVVLVTFGLNVRLDVSGEATTKSLSSLGAEPLLEILGESTWTLAIRMIRGDGGVGDFPGVRGGSGESLEFLRN